jgi:acyl-CoA thioester hydrolase
MDLIPTAGEFKGREHYYPIRVFYEDTDFTGIVYYANYLRFFERARSSFFRSVGFKHAELWNSEEPIAFAIRSIHLEYMKAAKIDDDLNIVTTYDKIKGARLWVNQSCYRGDELLVTAFSEAACISPEGKPKRAPSWMISQLSQYLLTD